MVSAKWWLIQGLKKGRRSNVIKNMPEVCLGHHFYNYKSETDKKHLIRQTAKTFTEMSCRKSIENIAFFKCKNIVVMESVTSKQLLGQLMCIKLSRRRKHF